MRLYKRGSTWWGWYYEDGKRVSRSTQCRDRKAAELVARNWERDSADPRYAAARTATLSAALNLLLENRQERATAGRGSQDTVDFYRSKAGHLVRIFEHDEDGNRRPFLLSRLQAFDVDQYISRRRAEGAGENTLSKELVTLRASLRLAKRAGLWAGEPSAVCPIAFAPEYKPKSRFLTPDELKKLLAELTADRAARVAFIVATSACWKESELALRQDVAQDLSVAVIRGTKRSSRFRTVPIVSGEARSLLQYALRHAEGKEGFLFRAWGNVRRDLLQACERARIAPCSPNDLRRTCATWLRAAGAPPDLIAPLMGHVDTRMVERVYGRLSPEALADRLVAALGPDRCSAFVAARGETAGFLGPIGRSGIANHLETVPRAGIEPATRGFSVLCSTD